MGLERVETEPWKLPPEPLLEQISAFLSLDRKEWVGTPTELAAHLGVDMKPNALTRLLNVNAGRLLNMSTAFDTKAVAVAASEP